MMGTTAELRWAVKHKLPLVVLKMCNEYTSPVAEMQLDIVQDLVREECTAPHTWSAINTTAHSSNHAPLL